MIFFIYSKITINIPIKSFFDFSFTFFDKKIFLEVYELFYSF